GGPAARADVRSRVRHRLPLGRAYAARATPARAARGRPSDHHRRKERDHGTAQHAQERRGRAARDDRAAAGARSQAWRREHDARRSDHAQGWRTMTRARLDLTGSTVSPGGAIVTTYQAHGAGARAPYGAVDVTVSVAQRGDDGAP